MVLTPDEFANGLTGLIFSIIVLYVGLRIAFKYLEFKQKTMLYVGIGYIGTSGPYYAVSASFVSVLITGQPINDVLYFSIGVVGTPIFFILWMLGFSELLYKHKQTLIIVITALIAVLFEIYFLYGLFTDTTLIGVKEGPVDTDWSTITTIYFLMLVVIILITGILFGRASIRSDNPEVKLKGKFLILAFILYVVGAMLDVAIDYPITRIIMMLSSIAFYFGWIMPEWMKKSLVKQA